MERVDVRSVVAALLALGGGLLLALALLCTGLLWQLQRTYGANVVPYCSLQYLYTNPDACDASPALAVAQAQAQQCGRIASIAAPIGAGLLLAAAAAKLYARQPRH